MSKIFVCCLLFVLSGSFFAQQSKEEKLKQLKSRSDIKATEIENDILKLEYPSGKVVYKNIGDYKLPATYSQLAPTYDSTIIDLTTIDTSLYNYKYKFWLQAPIGSLYEPIIGDINNNGLPEIYGLLNLDTIYINVAEMNSNGIFSNVYNYDSALIVKSIYDIDKDGGKDLQLGSNSIFQQYPGNSYLFYKKQSDSSLATQLSFIFYRVGGQQENNYLGDWDGDDYTDWIFVDVISTLPSINIYEFNPVANYFDSVFSYDIGNNHHGGFAIGDFDQDGKTEFIGGSIQGDVLSIENSGNNNYVVNWNGSVETYNAYLATQTNDLDGNGKDEIWIVGAAFYNGVPKTRITLFESIGNNSYAVVGRIDFVGVFPFDAFNIQSLDVDNDGKDEVMICVAANVIVLKFAGITNHQKYEVFYIKQNTIPGIYYYGATMYDLDNDGKNEIIISMQDYPNTGHKLLSEIFKPDSTTNVISEIAGTTESYLLYQNYPNPFNPTTNIEYSIPEASFVQLKVYDILGNEVATLVNEEQSAGIYRADFSGTDLASGLYIAKLQAGNYSKTIKMSLLK
ncbi:MAG: T9SS type A sorting domain-containing protein [Ignavibacterium sp.]|nr:T9SS type A sorting domain-containing protein [Ignavibacterium sp.]